MLDVIKKSFRNVVNSRNDCGMADQVSATQSYLGTTSRRPNVSADGACTDEGRPQRRRFRPAQRRLQRLHVHLVGRR